LTDTVGQKEQANSGPVMMWDLARLLNSHVLYAAIGLRKTGMKCTAEQA
jgi:hypothetical protein